MATRDDLTVDYGENPRIIEIAAPSTEITMQDLVDTVRIDEYSFSTPGMSNPKLLNASGKEDLGGGVLVGITADLQDAQLSFAPRRTPAETGTVTTGTGAQFGSPLGPTYIFEDTNADFVTAGVQRGSMVINFTDRSLADVIEVISATELRTRLLVNGADNLFEIGDIYQVFNIIQCNATGGNLVAQDDIGSRITSVFPSAFVQVVRTASSSATLQEQEDIQYSSFNGKVTVNVIGGSSGVDYPTGTPRQPSNNFTDALSIANTRGFDKFCIIGNANINLNADFSNFVFEGQSKVKTTLTLDPVANLAGAEFINSTITGTLDGGNIIKNCTINTLNYVDGCIEDSILNGPVALSGSADLFISNSYSGPDTTAPIIDFGGSDFTGDLGVANYNGLIELTNKSAGGDVSLDLNSGSVTIDDTVASGTVTLRGTGTWTNADTYAGTATVVDEFISAASVVSELNQTLYDGVTFENLLTDLLAMANGRIVESSPGVFDFYEQDNTTIAFTLTKSGSERTRS